MSVRGASAPRIRPTARLAGLRGRTPSWTTAVVALGVVGAVVGFAGSWIPSYWGDEAASVMSATRSWPSLFSVLGVVDGVHGLYYAFLHLWVDVFGTSELATRFPSALAAGALVSGTAVLVRHFVGPGASLLAGAVAIMLPRATVMAAEARSYAMGAAAVVWITVLLVRLLRREASGRVWLGYSVAVAASMYLFLYLGLLLLVHGAFVALRHRRSLLAWAGAAAVAVLLALPIVVLAFLQRQQIAFLAYRDYATVENVLVTQWFGSPPVAIVAGLLMIVAVVGAVWSRVRGDRADAGMRSLVLLAALWAALPTALLLLVDATLSPAYNMRYLSFCVPAVAVLIGTGIAALASGVPRRWQLVVSAGLVALLVAVCVPEYVSQRTSWGKDKGSDLRAVAEYIEEHAEPGAVVLFDQTTKPSQDPRLSLNLYPESFAGLQDVALKRPYQDRAGLWDAVVPNAEAMDRVAPPEDVWAVELTPADPAPEDVLLLQERGYRVVSAEPIYRSTVYHLTRQ